MLSLGPLSWEWPKKTSFRPCWGAKGLGRGGEGGGTGH